MHPILRQTNINSTAHDMVPSSKSITGRQASIVYSWHMLSPCTAFDKVRPLVPCSWSIHGSRLAQQCSGLWDSSSANGLDENVGEEAYECVFHKCSTDFLKGCCSPTILRVWSGLVLLRVFHPGAPHGSTSSRPRRRSSNPLGWSWSCLSAPDRAG